MKISKLMTIAVLTTAGLAAVPAHADTKAYTYKVFTADGTPTLSELRIEDEGGEVTVRILARNPSVCLQGKIPADKVVDATVTTYTLKLRYHDCQPTRMVIQNDGMGGRVELREGDNWVTRKVTQDYLVLKS